MPEALKLCPHCGSDASTPTMHWGSGTRIPRCTNPDCLAEARDAAAWNRRAPGLGTAKMLKESRDLIDWFKNSQAGRDWFRDESGDGKREYDKHAAFLAEHEPHPS